MTHKLISIVVPLYNEEQSIRELIDRIHRALSGKWPFEYVFVDDGSTDGSFGRLKEEKRRVQEPMTIVRFRKNSGKSMGLAEGFCRAKGDVIVTLDADLQDDPFEIPTLIRALDKGSDLVVGWKKKRRDEENRIMLSHIFNGVVSRIFHLPLHDMNCGLKVMKRSVIEEIDVYGELHRFIPVLAHTKGFVVTEVPIVHHARKYGTSKFGSERIIRAPFDLLSTMFITTFKTRPLQMFGSVGGMCIVIGAVQLVYLSVLHFMGESIGRRPLLLSGVLFVLFGVQLVSTGLLGELVTKTNIHNEKRPVAQVIE